MRRGTKIGLWVAGAVVTLLLIAVGGVLVLTNTDWGREQVRRRAVALLNSSVHGITKVGRIEGNLLTGATIRDLRMTDSLGMPFIAAREVRTRVSWRALVKKRLEFSNVTVVGADVVLDRQPGGRWNYDRILRPDTTTRPSTGPGFGSWITLRDVDARDVHLTVRTPWQPDSTLAAAQRDSVVKATLAGRTRNRVERVPRGFQKIMEFRDVYATLPYARVADPDNKTQQFDVSSARLIALPFLPPAVNVTALAGRFLVTPDSAYWTNARASLPGSKLVASGSYGISSGDLRLQAQAHPVAMSDLRWLEPALPTDGGGQADIVVSMVGKTQTYDARNIDVTTQGAHATGTFGVTLGDTAKGDSTWFHGTNLQAANLPTALIERLAPTVKLPREGTLGGHVAAEGSLRALTLDADVAFDDRRSGISRLAAKGVAGIDDGAFSARDLHLTLHPVQVDLARIAQPTLPIGGTLTGTTTLDGSTRTGLVAVSDLAHDDRGAHTAVTGRTLVRLAGKTPYVDADVRLHPLSLVTVGRFAPAAGLRGSASGPVTARGTLANLALDARLRTNDGGTVAARGTVDLASVEMGYDLALDASLFNANSVVAKAPQTSLTATARASGRGFSPATMRASLAADLRTSQLDSVVIDAATTRLRIANGVATVDTLTARGAGATLDAAGAFGLVAGRDGTITYHVTADSLAAFNRFLPAPDTGAVAPRPRRAAEVIARAAADSAKAAERAAVQRAAVGVVSVQQVAKQAQAATPVPRDSLSGSVYAAGSARGSIARFSMRGRLGARDLVAFGNTAHEVRAEYAWNDAMTKGSTVAAAVDADSVTAAGFAMDSAQLRTSYVPSTGDGTVIALVRQGANEEYLVRADVGLHLDQSELRFADLAIRLDTTRWAAARPGAVRWGARGIEVDSIDLRNGADGRVFVNGRIPKEGNADLRVLVHGFQVGDILNLAQSDVKADGLLGVDATLNGTLVAPRIAGTVGVTNASYAGAAVPDVRAKLDYAATSLKATVEAAERGGRTFLTATGTVPVNLSSTATGPRLPDTAPITADVVADSLPIDLIPKFTDAVADVRGHAALKAKVSGSLSDLRVDGGLTVADARARLVSTGVTLSRMNGNVRFRRDSVFVDSLVAYSGGPIRIRGGIDIRKPATPGFDLYVTARDAKLLDNERGRIVVNAGLAAKGPFDGVYVSGAVTDVHGLIRLPEPTGKNLVNANDPAVFSVVDTALGANRDLLPTQSPLLENLRVDVDVNVARNTWVRRSDVNVEVYSDGPLAVHVNRKEQALTLEGVMATERGEYNFIGKRFEITRGSATFTGTPDINPIVQATGEYAVNIPSREALTIRIIVGGTVQSPTVSLESDAQPPISQSDLISYLTFGQASSSLLQTGSSSSASGTNPGEGAVGAAGQFVQQKMAGLFLGVLVDQLQTQVGRSLGADVFRITPADVNAEVAQATRGQFSGLLSGTNIEYGRFFSPEVYVAATGSPSSIAFQQGTNTPLGVSVQRRTTRGLQYIATFEPRFILQPSTLSTQEAKQKGVLGLFLAKEWRF